MQKARTFLQHLMAAEHWFKKRDDYMLSARKNMRALMRVDGHWGYKRDDPRLLQANAVHVRMARRCHDIAMGRIPIVNHFTIANNGDARHGPLYTKKN